MGSSAASVLSRPTRRIRLEPLEQRSLLSISSVAAEDPYTSIGQFVGNDSAQSAVVRYVFDQTPQLVAQGAGCGVTMPGQESWTCEGDPQLPLHGELRVFPGGRHLLRFLHVNHP